MRDVESGRRRVGRARAAGARRLRRGDRAPSRGRSPARSIACRWTMSSCRPAAARCCRCCRSLPGEKREPPSSVVLSVLLLVPASRRSAPSRPSGLRRRSIGRRSGSPIALTFTVDIVCDRGVDILLDDLAKEKLRVNGLEILGSDSSATTDAAERTHAQAALRADHLSRGPAGGLDRADRRSATTRAGPASGCRTWRRRVRCTVPGAVVAYPQHAARQPAGPGLRDRRAAASRHPFFVRARIGRAGARRRSRWRRRCSWRRPRCGGGPCARPGRRSARQIRKEKRDTLERLRSLDVGTEEERRRAYDEISAAVRQHVAATPRTCRPPSLTAAEVDAALETLAEPRLARVGDRAADAVRRRALRSAAGAALGAEHAATRWRPPKQVLAGR